MLTDSIGKRQLIPFRYSLIAVGVVLSVGIVATLVCGRSRWSSPPRKLVHQLVWCFVVGDESHAAEDEETRRRREKELAAAAVLKRKEDAAAVNDAATIEDGAFSTIDLNLNEASEIDLEASESQVTRF